MHGYDSLSSRRYQAVIRSLGGQTRTYGRWSDSIAPDYGGAVFWMSNVGLVLAPARIEHPNLEYLGSVSGVHLHRVRDRMGCCLQLTPRPPPGTFEAAGDLDPRGMKPRRLEKSLDLGDRIELEVGAGGDSLLILSQAFHRDWHAEALLPGGWSEAQTVRVDGFFQGVLVPAGARGVRLAFEPWARFAWIAHGFWIAVLVVLAWRAARSRRRGTRRDRDLPDHARSAS